MCEVRGIQCCVLYCGTSSVAGVLSSGELLAGARQGLKAMGCPARGMPAAWPPGCNEGYSVCVGLCVSHCLVNASLLNCMFLCVEFKWSLGLQRALLLLAGL